MAIDYQIKEKIMYVKWTYEELAREVADAFRTAGESRYMQYDERKRVLHIGEGQDMTTAFMDNLYLRCREASQSNRAKQIGDYVAAFRQAQQGVPKAFGEARWNLVPQIRAKSSYTISELESSLANEDAPRVPHHSLNSHLIVALSYQFPIAIQEVGDAQLAAWGVSYEKARREALQNLAERSNEEFIHTDSGLYVSPWQDNLDASRLLLSDLFHQLDLPGEPVAMVPHRDLLMVTGSECIDGLDEMAAIAEEQLGEPYPIAYIPLRLTAEEWHEFSLPKQAPAELRSHYAMLKARTLRPAYVRQGELLQQLYSKRGDDIFVASYSALQEEGTGHVSSYCVWPDGLDSLLPRTDQIIFGMQVASQLEFVRVQWDDASEIVGELMHDQNIYPPRYRVQQFPAPEQLRQIRRVAIGCSATSCRGESALFG